MMRKLAVTVFALSFVAFGCGSDSDTTTPDGGKTSVDGPAAGKDVGVGPEVQVTVDSAVDVASPDGAIDQTPQIDVGSDLTVTTTPDAPIDAGQTGTEVGIDGLKSATFDGGIDGGIDGSVIHVDGGIDTGAAIDTGALDTGTTG